MISLRKYLASSLFALMGISSALAGSPENPSGNYGGVLAPASPSDPPSNSGLVQLQLSHSGLMTGVLIWQGQRYPFKGKLSDGTFFERTFKKRLSSIPTDLAILL